MPQTANVHHLAARTPVRGWEVAGDGEWAVNPDRPSMLWLVTACHLGLIAIPAGFGLDLLLTPHMFRALPNFAMLAALAGERTWGVMLLATAVFSLAGWRSRRWWLRCAGAFALGTVHWMIALCFLASGTMSTGATTYPVLAALAWCYALEARLAR